MIYSVEGTLAEKGPAFAVVDTGGVSYLVSVPLSTSEALPETGSRVKLYTHLVVTDDGQALFGFATREEKRMFEILITVPGIGPKVSLRVLSGLTAAELQRAVILQDVSALTKVPGIGKKLAERLVVELREQMQKEPVAGETGIGSRELLRDAVEALVTLGYRRSQAVAAVSAAMKHLGGAATLEKVIKEALTRV